MSQPLDASSQPEPWRPTIGMQGQPRKSLRFKLWLGIGVVALVLVGIGGYWFVTSSSVESQAAEHCQELVIDSLTSPASAEFSDLETTLAGTLYTTTGKVDSQNRFGAMIRAIFRCETRQQTDDQIFTKVTQLEAK